jgi:hypothetical protein
MDENSGARQLNLYAFGTNNPLSHVDVDGHAFYRVTCSDGTTGQCGVGAYPGSDGIFTADGMTYMAYVEGQQNQQQAFYDNWLANAQNAAQQQSRQQGQQNQSDRPSFSIQASHGNLQLINSQGSTVADYWYTTGMNGDTNPKDKGKGPLPPGKYTLNPKEISKAGFFRRFIDPRDWGDYRAPLHPESGTNTYGRSGFFLHGGWKRLGSEGCIKVNDLSQDRLFQLLQHSSGPVKVTVQ